MSMGSLLTFFVLAAMQKRYLSNLNAAIPQLIRGQVSLNHFYNTIQLEDREPYQGQLKHQPCSISLKNVSFKYQQETILDEINLCINSSSSIAIIGPNGSGKSTIAKLILGFYQPKMGSLYADGIPYEQLDMQYLRKSIGVITQSPELFSGSILDNITYGYPNADFNSVIQAAILATADQFIQTFSNGYNTFVGENGKQLSGGQRQRIAIARALLHQPTLLILDEPSNHLDNKSIVQLIKNLKSLPNNPALMIISHDMQLLKVCDYVYQLQEGRLTLSQQFSQSSKNLENIR